MPAALSSATPICSSSRDAIPLSSLFQFDVDYDLSSAPVTTFFLGLVASLAVTANTSYPDGTTLHPPPNSNLLEVTHPPTVSATTPAPEVPVRVVNGSSECSGWVELFHQGVWRPLCREFWDSKGADVICRQLGCGLSRTSNHSGDGVGLAPFWVNLMNCTGTEAEWTDCPGDMLAADQLCDRNLTAGLVCAEHKEVRLVGGGSRCAGRVEINSNGTWGTVCDDTWDLPAASVVCRQLGCGSAISAVNASSFGQGGGPIYMDEVRCSGSEAYLWLCPSEPWLQHDCGHKEDAGVVCSGHRQIRLMGGPNRCSGRVSVRDRGTWGTVCDTIWNLTLAHAVCQHLGCGNASSLDTSYQLAGEHRWRDMCRPGTMEIVDCIRPLPPEACEPDSAAGVICTGSIYLTESPINVSNAWMTTAPVRVEGNGRPREEFLLLVIGLLVLCLIILGILFVVNHFKMRRRMVMRLSQSSQNNTAVTTNEYREMSITPNTNNTKPPARTVPQVAADDSDSLGDDYEDYDSFAPNRDLNFSTFKYSVRNQSERRLPQGNIPMTLPEVRITANDKGQRSDLPYQRSKDDGSSSDEGGARVVSSADGRKPSKRKSHRWKQHPSYKKSTDSSSTSSCEWYENTNSIGNNAQTNRLAVPPQSEFQSSTSTLPLEEYENVDGDPQRVVPPSAPGTPAPVASAAVNPPGDESTESDYDDIDTYFPT
ncbi:T-cell differentiation antigen CD6-like [Mustelus asterias]